MQTVQIINSSDLKEKLQRGEVVLIDVRDGNEFASDHIIQALNLPLATVEQHFSAFEAETRPLVFTCQKGLRSKMAADKALAAMSGKTIYSHEGGIEAWHSAGLPTTAGNENHGLPMMRQVFLAAGGFIFFFSLLALFGLKFGAFITLLMSCGFLVSGLTGFCALSYVLQKMPWNQKS